MNVPLRLAVIVSIVGPTALACSQPASYVPDAGADATIDRTRDGDVVRVEASHDVLASLDAQAEADAGVPRLTDLTVSLSPSDSSVPASLVPTFSSDVFDYYIRCGAGQNSVTVSMTASAGSKSLLLQPTTSPPLPAQTLALHVAENQAIVAAATLGTLTTEYWVRCLPHDFPELRMSAHATVGSPPAGYYLVGDFLPTAPQGAYAMVLDVHGVPVWYSLGAGGGMGDVDQIVSGAVSFIAFDAPSPEFAVHTLDPSWTVYAAPRGVLLDGHELQVVPGGQYVVISNPVESGFDLTGISIPLPDGGTETFGPGSSIQGCNVVEFDSATGAVTWQWTGSDHLDPVKDTTLPALGTFGAVSPDGGAVVDPFHCNSVDVDPSNGNLLVSARNADSVFYVDRSTSRIVWKLGGAAFSKDRAAYVTAADPFYRQHDARLLPGWSSTCAGAHGQISMFDDESQRPAPSRGVVYDVVVSGPEGGATDCDAAGTGGTATVAWQYPGAVNSTGVGSFRILPDGSRVIGWGFGAPNFVFTEVDADGHDLLDFEFTDGNSSYRAIKVPLAALDLRAMRSTAGAQ